MNISYRMFVIILSSLVSANANAQNAVQASIAKKLSAGGALVKCAGLSGAGDLSGTVCSERTAVPEMNEGYINSEFGSQLEYKDWVKFGKSSYFNIWKSSVFRYPVYITPSPKDPEALTLITIGRVGASLPRNDISRGSFSQPSVPRARNAGATRGAAYTGMDDIEKFFSLSGKNNMKTIKYGKQTMQIFLNQNIGYLNGSKINMQGRPFTLDSKIYYPAGIHKFFGCTIDPVIGELGIANALNVTCISGKETKNDFVHNWIF